MPSAAETPHDRLDALWREHASAVVRYARRRVLPSEVDEVVAETFMVAWRRLEDVPDFPLPWLLGVARGVTANSLRTARRQDALTQRLAATAAPDAVEPVGEANGLSGEVVSALNALRVEERELLLLLAWDGLNREEAAAALGISRGTLAVRLHRIRRRLKDHLARSTTPTHVADGLTVTCPSPVIGPT